MAGPEPDTDAPRSGVTDEVAALRAELDALRRPRLRPVFVYWPVFERTADLHEHLARAAWHLHPADPERIVFFAGPACGDVAGFRAAAHFDPRVEARVHDLGERVRVVAWDGGPAALAELFGADAVLRWRAAAEVPVPRGEQGRALRVRQPVHPVDPERDPQETAEYLRASLGPGPQRERWLAASRDRLRDLLRRHGAHRTATVFGTGATLADFQGSAAGEGVRFACNGIVLDGDLMARIAPHVVVLDDPRRHFGCSRAAGRFRAALGAAAGRFDFDLAVPLEACPLLAAEVPGLEGRLVGIPVETTGRVNLDLAGTFRAEAQAEVLTTLALPLASTLADDVRLVGCDGRTLADPATPWQRHPATALAGDGEDLLRAHPAGARADPRAWYPAYCDAVRRTVEAGERLGLRFEPLTPSYVPALRRRYAVRGTPAEASFYPKVSIVLDAVEAEPPAGDAVAAVLHGQAYPNFELVVVHAGAVAGGLDLDRLAGDARVVLLEDGAPSRAARLAAGLRAASGDLVSIVDARTILRDDTLECRICSLVGSGHDAVYCGLDLLHGPHDGTGWHVAPAAASAGFLDLERLPFHPTTVVVRRDRLAGNDRLDDALSDPLADLVQRLARAGVVFHDAPGAEVGRLRGAVPPPPDRGEAEQIAARLHREDPRVPDALPEYARGVGVARQLDHRNRGRFQAVVGRLLGGEPGAAEDPEISAVLLSRLPGEEIGALIDAAAAHGLGCAAHEWRGVASETQRRDLEAGLAVLGRRTGVDFSRAADDDAARAASGRQRTLEDVVREKNEAIERRDAIIDARIEAIERRDATIAEKNRSLAAREAEIAEQRRTLRRREVAAAVRLSRWLRRKES